MSDRVDLARVLALDAAATPGPWDNSSDGWLYFGIGPPTDDSGLALLHWFDNFPDADLIACYRTAAPAMARMIQARDARIAELEAKLQELRGPARDAVGLWGRPQVGPARTLNELCEFVLRLTAPTDEKREDAEIVQEIIAARQLSPTETNGGESEYNPFADFDAYCDRHNVPMDQTSVVLMLVGSERKRQDALKAEGRFDYTCADILPEAMKLAILMEEVGEVARQVLTQPGVAIANDTSGTRVGLQKELIQVAAVAVAWVEAIRRSSVEKIAG